MKNKAQVVPDVVPAHILGKGTDGQVRLAQEVGKVEGRNELDRRSTMESLEATMGKLKTSKNINRSPDRCVAYAEFEPVILDSNQTVIAKLFGVEFNQKMLKWHYKVCDHPFYVPIALPTAAFIPAGLLFIWSRLDVEMGWFYLFWIPFWLVYSSHALMVLGLSNLIIIKHALLRFETLFLLFQIFIAYVCFVVMMDTVQIISSMAFLPGATVLVFLDAGPRVARFRSIGFIFYSTLIVGYSLLILFLRYKIIPSKDIEIILLGERISLRTIYYSCTLTFLSFSLKTFVTFVIDSNRYVTIKSFIKFGRYDQKIEHTSHETRKLYEKFHE